MVLSAERKVNEVPSVRAIAPHPKKFLHCSQLVLHCYSVDQNDMKLKNYYKACVDSIFKFYQHMRLELSLHQPLYQRGNLSLTLHKI